MGMHKIDLLLTSVEKKC